MSLTCKEPLTTSGDLEAMAPGDTSTSEIAGVLRMVLVHNKYRNCDYVFKPCRLIPQFDAVYRVQAGGDFAFRLSPA